MCAETPDYKSTLNLPKTDFPMRAGLPKREPQLAGALVEHQHLRLLRAKSAEDAKAAGQARESPLRCMMDRPYANGHLHIGHALNKIHQGHGCPQRSR